MAASTLPCTSGVVSQSFSSVLTSSRSSISGTSLALPLRDGVSTLKKSLAVVSCRAEKSDDSNAQVSRRLALSLLVGAAAVSTRVTPASAYGEPANIFATPKPDALFVSYSGRGFKVNVPAKWNPSREVEFPGQVLRYEDNFDSLSNLSVSVVKVDKSSIKDYGSPQEFLNSVSYLLGKQSYSGKTVSEGGFDPNSVVTASVLDASTSEANGKLYYNLSVLTRTGDGTEGGRHQLIVGTVSGGQLYILKAQAGDKRWFKGAKKLVEGAASSFNVA